MGNFLEGKVAAVTGAGRGIGRSITLLMAEEGAKVVVNDLGVSTDGRGSAKEPADEVVSEIKANGGQAVSHYGDVSMLETGESLVKAAVDNFGRLDILVNNAGIIRFNMLFKMTPEEWDGVIKVHLYGLYNCTKPACAFFRKQRSGRIINISSGGGLGYPAMANYSTAKEGIIGFTRTIAREMGGYGVTCNAIRPIAETRFSPDTNAPIAKAAEQVEADGVGPLVINTQVTHFGESMPDVMPGPDDVAPFVVWLAGDEAGNVNGHDFYVGGGHVGLYSQPTMTKSISKDGRWTVGELRKLVPGTLALGLVNPAPPPPHKD